jgi:hypothetical protein
MLASQRLFILSGVTAVLLLGLIYHNFGQDTYSLRDLTSMHKGNGGASRFDSYVSLLMRPLLDVN